MEPLTVNQDQGKEEKIDGILSKMQTKSQIDGSLVKPTRETLFQRSRNAKKKKNTICRSNIIRGFKSGGSLCHEQPLFFFLQNSVTSYECCLWISPQIFER